MRFATTNRIKRGGLLAFILGAVPAVARGSVVAGTTYLDSTIQSVTSENGFGLDRPAVALVNGAGLNSATGQHTITPDGTAAANDGHMWLSAAGVPQVMVFKLTAPADLTSLHVWNYNEPGDANGNYSVKDLTISTSADNVTYGPATAYVFAVGTGSATTYTGADYPLVAAGVQYVKFNMTSNYRTNNSNLNVLGLSEVRFQVPEPTSAALLGVAAAGLLARRRRNDSCG